MTTNKIEPALSAEQWELVREFRTRPGGPILGIDRRGDPTGTAVARIAIENDRLPSDDPRKVTREWIVALRDVAREYEGRHDESRERVDWERQNLFEQMADALASYLPPEGA